MFNNPALHKIYNILFLFFCVIIPFEEKAKAVPNILIAVLAFVWIFIIKRNDLVGLLKSKAFAFFTVFLLYIALNSLIKNQFFEDIFVFRKFAISLVVILLAIPIKNIRLIKRSFILSTLSAVLVSLINIFIYIYTQEGFKFSLGEMVNELLVSERLYIGFCCVISFVFLVEEFKLATIKSTKILISIIGVLIISFVFLIAARMAIISIILIWILLIITQLSFKKKIITTISLMLFVTIFFSFNQNLTKRFFRADDKYRKTFFDKVATHEPRFIIWNCSMKILKNEFDYFFGNGFNNTKNELVNCYKKDIQIDHKRDWFVKSRFNTHNQFLDLLISSGIIGLLIFLIMLFYTYKNSQQDFLAIALISSLILILFIDNIFHRQIGNYLFALIFIATSKQKGNRLLSKR